MFSCLKAKSDTSKGIEEEVALRIHSSDSVYSPRSSPHADLDIQNAESKKMSRKVYVITILFTENSDQIKPVVNSRRIRK